MKTSQRLDPPAQSKSCDFQFESPAVCRRNCKSDYVFSPASKPKKELLKASSVSLPEQNQEELFRPSCSSCRQSAKEQTSSGVLSPSPFAEKRVAGAGGVALPSVIAKESIVISGGTTPASVFFPIELFAPPILLRPASAEEGIASARCVKDAVNPKKLDEPVELSCPAPLPAKS